MGAGCWQSSSPRLVQRIRDIYKPKCTYTFYSVHTEQILRTFRRAILTARGGKAGLHFYIYRSCAWRLGLTALILKNCFNKNCTHFIPTLFPFSLSSPSQQFFFFFSHSSISHSLSSRGQTFSLIYYPTSPCLFILRVCLFHILLHPLTNSHTSKAPATILSRK